MARRHSMWYADTATQEVQLEDGQLSVFAGPVWRVNPTGHTHAPAAPAPHAASHTGITDPLAVSNGIQIAGGSLQPTYGSLVNTVCQGNDGRLSDSRPPTGAASGGLTGNYPNPTLAAVGATTTTKGTASKSATISIDANGRVTGLSDADIAITASQVTWALTAGSVIFAGVGGTSLTQDNTNFFWDNTNKRLGINHGTTPAADIHVGTGEILIAGHVAYRLEPVYTSVLSLGYDRIEVFHPTWNYNHSIGNCMGIEVIPEVASGKTVNTLFGIYESPVTTGNITTWYGFYLDAKTGAGTITNNYDMILIGGGKSSCQAGNAPTAKWHIGAGSATAGTAPLKINSGTLLATPEVGAMEFLTDALYFTITTGAVRKTLQFSGDAVSLNISKGIAVGSGDYTANTYSGRAQFAIGATSLTVTNSLCATTSIITATCSSAPDATGAVRTVVAGGGSFVIHVVAPTAVMTVDWRLSN